MWLRWLRFNTVGAAGFVVQLGGLWLLVELGDMSYVLATLVATELAVVHNFVWHVRWTWMERDATSARIFWRFVRFNLSNGAVSLVGNASLVALLTGWMSVPYLPANLAGIAVCCILNFLLSEWFVFAPYQVTRRLREKAALVGRDGRGRGDVVGRAQLACARGHAPCQGENGGHGTRATRAYCARDAAAG
jgi:putative flippase GtrA